MHSTLPRPLSCPMADRQLLVPIRTVPVVLCCVSLTVRNPSKALYQCRVVHERIAGPWQCTGFIGLSYAACLVMHLLTEKGARI